MFLALIWFFRALALVLASFASWCLVFNLRCAIGWQQADGHRPSAVPLAGTEAWWISSALVYATLPPPEQNAAPAKLALALSLLDCLVAGTATFRARKTKGPGAR